MAKINCLDEHLRNMIAAGEVVERPSGIVKELVENSIDAHAKHIEIRIKQGGIESICIIDDGEGMDYEDSRLAFERHATSKLKQENDLWNIHTMGFRGEALPSIASVSHVCLRTNNGVEGSEIEINYGKQIKHAKCACMQGTTIEVLGLFQKTPARFKHLKSPNYEFSLISEVVSKFAFSHPEIAFLLYHNEKIILKTSGNNNLREIIMQTYGRDCAKSAIELNGEDQDYQIKGFIMQPQYNRATKYYMQLYINGRMIRNYHLQKCIIDAYEPYLATNRYPIAIIHINMDAQLVDVNVHPSKWEIRLSKEKQLEKLLFQTIENALKQSMKVVKMEVKEKEEVIVEMPVLNLDQDSKMESIRQSVNESFKEIQMDDIKEENHEVKEQEVQYHSNKTSKEKEIVEEKIENKVELIETKQEKQPEIIVEGKSENIKQERIRNASFPQLEVIGQFHNNYIIAQGEKGLYIIDQHAAQERYHYEIIRERILNGEKNTQSLLIPITLEVSPAILTMIDECNQLFETIGIHFDIFGEQSLIVRELPLWMNDIEEKAFLLDMLDIWQENQKLSIELLRKKAIATMACHSSIRFHRSLSLMEMKQVIRDLEKCEQPFHCPHGRPTLLCIEDKDLFHQFERG